jgi:riboflavin synthase
VNGISLTVVEVINDLISLVLIPHTLLVTTLGRKSKGAVVNIESDIIGKYILSNLPKN